MMPSKRRATLIACQVPLTNHLVRIYGKQAPQYSLTYWHHFGSFGAPCGSPLLFPHQPNPNDQTILTCDEALASWTETLEESFSCTIDVCRAVETGDPYKLKSFPQNLCQAPWGLQGADDHPRAHWTQELCDGLHLSLSGASSSALRSCAGYIIN